MKRPQECEGGMAKAEDQCSTLASIPLLRIWLTAVLVAVCVLVVMVTVFCFRKQYHHSGGT